MIVVVHAGGSGVGTATQLATEHGCKVFVTAGTDEKIAKGLNWGSWW